MMICAIERVGVAVVLCVPEVKVKVFHYKPGVAVGVPGG
jgi:hypothetical protein